MSHANNRNDRINGDERRESVLGKAVPSKAYCFRYKTEFCNRFIENNDCEYGNECQFAHSIEEKRELPKHPKYKTELCESFHKRGECSYGIRCNFIHNIKTIKPIQSANIDIPTAILSKVNRIDSFGSFDGSFPNCSSSGYSSFNSRCSPSSISSVLSDDMSSHASAIPYGFKSPTSSTALKFPYLSGLKKDNDNRIIGEHESSKFSNSTSSVASGTSIGSIDCSAPYSPLFQLSSLSCNSESCSPQEKSNQDFESTYNMWSNKRLTNNILPSLDLSPMSSRATTSGSNICNILDHELGIDHKGHQSYPFLSDSDDSATGDKDGMFDMWSSFKPYITQDIYLSKINSLDLPQSLNSAVSFTEGSTPLLMTGSKPNSLNVQDVLPSVLQIDISDSIENMASDINAFSAPGVLESSRHLLTISPSNDLDVQDACLPSVPEIGPFDFSKNIPSLSIDWTLIIIIIAINEWPDLFSSGGLSCPVKFKRLPVFQQLTNNHC